MNSKIHQEVDAVITSFNQESMIREAVYSLCRQTVRPGNVIIVDDGTTGKASLEVLHELEQDTGIPVPLSVIRQENRGVSAARNTGIRKTRAPLVLVLDGDDSLEPAFIEAVCKLLGENPSMTAASSWMRTFGVLEAEVRPAGGPAAAFLSRNGCPATHIFRREAWRSCGGYDESMRGGFEDWDFFLSMLEAVPGSQIGIVKEPLMNYRTAPASSNIRSMEKRLELMKYLIEKHIDVYKNHVADAVLGLEAISMSRLWGWECEMIRAKSAGLCGLSATFMESPSYGDGGMAAAVRIASFSSGER